MPRNLAVVVPGLTNCNSDVQAESFERYLGDTQGNLWDRITVYAHTWDNPHNDTTGLKRLCKNNRLKLVVQRETYDELDRLVADYMKNTHPEFGRAYQETYGTLDRDNRINRLRKCFSIFYKLPRVISMIAPDDNYVMRIQANSTFQLRLSLDELETIEQTWQENRGSTWHTGSNSVNREWGWATPISTSANTMFVGVDEISALGETKISERCMFAHRDTFRVLTGKRLFERVALPAYAARYLLNHEHRPPPPLFVNPPPVPGSQVWAALLAQRRIHAMPGVAYAGDIDRSAQPHPFY